MRTVSEIGKAIADEIEAKGHYQSKSLEDADNGKVCVIASDAYWQGKLADRRFFDKAFSEKAGTEPRLIGKWNDETPTDIVLATLRSL